MCLAARLIAAPAWLAAVPTLALAQDRPDGAFPWQMDLQKPATYMMEYVHWFSWYTLVIMFAIVLFVVGLIAWVVWRYNEKSNPVPTRVTHHTLIEVLWTVLPVLILVAVAVPSFKLLYGQYDPSKLYEDFDPDSAQFLTVKVTGYQWYWGYEYGQDEDSVALGAPESGLAFEALMIPDADLPENGIRNLSVDNPLVVPVNTYVRLQVTGGDVIHSFGMPAFGIKEDAVPGRLNETYFNAEREGVFYGQCSELCGKDHAFMPAAIHVVSQEQFRAWSEAASSDLAGAYERLARMIDGRQEAITAAR